LNPPFALNHCGGVLRGVARDSIASLPARVVERIEQLHCTEKPEYALTLMATLAALAARLRGGLAGFFRALSGRFLLR